MTLDVRAGHIILRLKEVLLSGLLMLEDKDGMECHKHSKNYALCHLPIEGTIHLEPTIVPEDLPCFVCGEKKWVATMLSCDQCQSGWHMTCLRSPLISLPSGQWSCSRCRRSSVPGAFTSSTQ